MKIAKLDWISGIYKLNLSRTEKLKISDQMLTSNSASAERGARSLLAVPSCVSSSEIHFISKDISYNKVYTYIQYITSILYWLKSLQESFNDMETQMLSILAKAS